MIEKRIMHIQILLADDHYIVSEGLSELINSRSDMEVIKVVNDGKKAVEMALKYNPDIVLMDIAMPILNGIESTRQIKINNPNTKIIGLSMNTRRNLIIEMIKAGASGYLVKECKFEEIIKACKTVIAGDLYISNKVNNILIKELVESENSKSVFSLLTTREREILQLLVEGHHTKETASKLNISDKTVHSHRKSIMEKLNANSVVDLIKFAIKEGIIFI